MLGIIALITAAIAFFNPGASLMAVTAMFGVSALFRGAILFASRSALKAAGASTFATVLLAIINIVAGVFLLMNLWVGFVVLPTLFAIWFIIDSVLGLMNAGQTRAVWGNGSYWFRVILGLVCVALGVMLLFDPISAALTMSYLIGFYFVFLATICFIEAYYSIAPRASTEQEHIPAA